MVLTGYKTSLIHRTKPEKLLRIAQFRGGLIVIFNLEKNETLLFEYFIFLPNASIYTLPLGQSQYCQSDDQWTITGTQLTLQITTCPL